MVLKKEILDNGILLYSLKIPEAKNILVSINVRIGSIYENEDKRGISHFLEHMMFKSNRKYSAEQISKGLELCGGISNAFTSTFLTSYFTEVIPDGFPRVIDIFYSMFENEKYDEKELELERKVILSEIERIENNPESLLERLIPQSVFGKSDYGEPIGGYRETIISISKEDIEEFKSKYFSSKNMFILIEGNFSYKHLEVIKKIFSRLEENDCIKKKPSKSKGKDIIKKADTKNQIYFSKNFEVRFDKDKKFYVPFAFSKVISGGISSLLFNIFREKYGIGYGIFFEPSYYFEDSMILSLEIPGYEKEKDRYIEIAYEDLINEINNEKKFNKYFEGRKKVIRLKYEKLRLNLFKRGRIEPYLITWRETYLEKFYSEIFKVSKNEVVRFFNSLKNEKIVKLISF